MRQIAWAVALALSLPAAVHAQTKVENRDAFLSLVGGKTLLRPLVQLNVSPDGTISGSGSGLRVSGNWAWEDGYFCRQLEWPGGSEDRNCQEVSVEGDSIRFRADKGNGDFADFKIR